MIIKTIMMRMIHLLNNLIDLAVQGQIMNKCTYRQLKLSSCLNQLTMAVHNNNVSSFMINTHFRTFTIHTVLIRQPSPPLSSIKKKTETHQHQDHKMYWTIGAFCISPVTINTAHLISLEDARTNILVAHCSVCVFIAFSVHVTIKSFDF